MSKTDPVVLSSQELERLLTDLQESIDASRQQMELDARVLGKLFTNYGTLQAPLDRKILTGAFRQARDFLRG